MLLSTPSTDESLALASRRRRFAETSDQPDDGVDARTARAELDRLLQLIERRPFSVLELRLLLQLHDGEATISQLSVALDHDASEVLGASRRLVSRGFVRRRSIGPHRQGLFCIARPGIIAVRPFLTVVAPTSRRRSS